MRNILLFVLLCCLSAATAQTERRVALVVGNARYANSPLTNPGKDAKAMAVALREAGFSVTEKYDLRYDSFNRAVTDFGRNIKGANTVALFYYSGHGVQYDGKNYLVPIGAENMRDEDDINGTCVPENNVVKKMEIAGNKMNIIVLDACRTFPVVRINKTADNGFAEVTRLTPELLVAYATWPGSTAADVPNGKNSLFTGSLLKHLRTPGYDIEQVFKETRKDVLNSSGGKQRPYVVQDLTSTFYFFPNTTATTPPNPLPTTTGAGPILPKPETYTDPIVGTMVHVKGGTFTMGCQDGRDTECYEWEKPAHTVRVSDFYIGETEVTQKQWRAVMGSDPSYFKDCDDCPVEQVSWNDIQDFLSKLNARSGRYRLPTEAEWEYAARGGAYSHGYKYAGSNTVYEVAWFWENSGEKMLSGDWDYEKLKANNCRTQRVKTKRRNELGLYDMSGNVYEWCADCWHDTYEGHPTDGSAWTSGSCDRRVLRGGSWFDGSRNVRVSIRYVLNPDVRLNVDGFRLARTAP